MNALPKNIWTSLVGVGLLVIACAHAASQKDGFLHAVVTDAAIQGEIAAAVGMFAAKDFNNHGTVAK